MIVEDNLPARVPDATIDAGMHPATLWEALADRLGDEPAVIQGVTTTTWQEFDRHAAGLAATLQRSGLGAEAKVATYLFNGPEFLESYFAAFKIRAQPVNVNYRYSRIPIGTGPFVFKSRTPDHSFDATRNLNYWRSGLPYLDEVVFKPIPDSSTRIAALQTGDINVTVTSRNDDIAKLTTAAKAGQVQLAASAGPPDTNSLLLNTAKAPTATSGCARPWLTPSTSRPSKPSRPPTRP